MSPSTKPLHQPSRKTEVGLVILLLILFIIKNSFLAFFGPPWYGEDELSHFGYIEALARTHHWYSFKDNFASAESYLARDYYWQATNKRQALADIASGKFQSLRQTVSTHPNATAYQPPLYYWLMAQIYTLFNQVNVLGLLYLFRFINVLLGALTLIIAYLLAESVIPGTTSRLVFMAFLTFHPLYSFLTGTVTSQVLIILLSTLMFALLHLAWKYHWSALIILGLILTLTLGLLTHQMFLLFVPLILVAALFDLFSRRLTLSYFVALLLTFIVSGLPLIPQYLERHQDTQYTIAAPYPPHPWNLTKYLITQVPRLKTELFTGLWVQVRGNILYSAPSPLMNTIRFITLVSGVGLVVGFARKLFDFPQKRWLTLALASLMILMGAHLVLDYLQYHLNAQEYFKGRYLFISLLPLASLYVLGWKALLKSSRWYTALSMSLICYFILFNLSAVLWLITQMSL